MFQLDDQFLEDIGLANLPEEERKPFLQHVYDQLEYRVGVRLSEGMTDAQLEEFEAIIDRKEEVVDAWVAQHVPEFAQDSLYEKIQTGSGLPAGDFRVKAEYAATKWLEVNRPDYRDVVAQTLEALKQEIGQNKDTILSPQAPSDASSAETTEGPTE